jgi:hypothetical protein
MKDNSVLFPPIKPPTTTVESREKTVQHRASTSDKRKCRILVAIVVVVVFVIAIGVSVYLSRHKRKTSVAIPPPPTQAPSRQDETAIQTETIAPGFPDAIRCSENGHIFYFAAAGKYESLLTTNATGDEERNQVTFNTTTGEFLNRTGSNEFNYLCLQQSIDDLYRLGRAYSFVASSTAKEPTDGEVIFPDAILCADNQRFYVEHQRNGGRYDCVSGGGYINYNADGTYQSQGDVQANELCEFRSIRTLYQERRAFRFHRSGVPDPDGITSMEPNFPDVVQCGGTGRADVFYRSSSHIFSSCRAA